LLLKQIKQRLKKDKNPAIGRLTRFLQGFFISCFLKNILKKCFLSGDKKMLKKLAKKALSDYKKSVFITVSLLQEDLKAFVNNDPSCEGEAAVLEYYPTFFALCAYRIAHVFYLSGAIYLSRAISELAHAKTGIDIHAGAVIGSGFFIDHGVGIVIGETAVIGNNCKIYHGVTLGALSVKGNLRGQKRHPTVGDNVTLYANSTVLGGKTFIKSDSVVGANAFIKG